MIKIGIITSTTRPNRVSVKVAEWVKDVAKDHKPDVHFEVVDIKDYDLPLMETISPFYLNGEYGNDNVVDWSKKIDSLDGFIFVTAEYNKTPPAALLNAIDLIGPEWMNKSAGIVGYGSSLGVSAVQVLRLKLANFNMATVQQAGGLNLFTDFEDMAEFKPAEHNIPTIQSVTDQTVQWAEALKTV